MKIGIVGLGLIGSSLARALKRCGEYEVTGVDTSDDTLVYAVKNNLVKECGNSLNLIKDCEVIFVCTPAGKVNAVVSDIFKLAGKNAIITDTASIKEPIIKNLPEGVRFVGGHPMAGRENGGIENGSATLFENAYYILTEHEGVLKEDAEKVRKILSVTGALFLTLTPAEHDRAVSRVSHLPHVLAYALCGMFLDGEAERKTAAGSFRDLTRVADSAPDFWTDIIFQNKENVSADIDMLADCLGKIKGFLAAGDKKAVERFFESAKQKRSKSVSLKEKERYSLNVDIPDRPGELAALTELVFKAGVNISNISVAASRENGGGALCLEFSGYDNFERAGEVLAKAGYKVN